MADCREESEACKNDRETYDLWAQLQTDVVSDINRVAGQANNANNTAIGAGTFACAAGAFVMMTNPVGWLLGIGVVCVGIGSYVCGKNVGKGIAKDEELTTLKLKCKYYVSKMMECREKAKKDCKNPDCVPPMPTPCP